jgi:hypothetical protein
MRCDRFFIGRTVALLFGMLLLLIAPPASAAANTWSSAAPLATARYFHTATLLPSGKVLVAGGKDGAETPHQRRTLRSGHQYLECGGFARVPALRAHRDAAALGQGAGGGGGNNVAELYDPATNSWSSISVLATARYRQTATLLPSGKVLVAGGLNGAPSPVPSSTTRRPTAGARQVCSVPDATITRQRCSPRARCSRQPDWAAMAAPAAL